VLLVNEAIVDLRERLTAAFETSLLLSAARRTTSKKDARQLGGDSCRAGGSNPHLPYEPLKQAGIGVVVRLSRVLVVDACDLQYSLLLLSRGRLALAFRSAQI
jgi:hypothetical protein